MKSKIDFKKNFDENLVCLPMCSHRQYKKIYIHYALLASVAISGGLLLSTILLYLETIRDPEFGHKLHIQEAISNLGILGSMGVVATTLGFFLGTRNVRSSHSNIVLSETLSPTFML